MKRRRRRRRTTTTRRTTRRLTRSRKIKLLWNKAQPLYP